MKNGQVRDTGSIGKKRHRAKTIQTHKKKTQKKTRHNTERVVSSSCFLLGTRRVTDIYIVKFDKSVRGKKKST